MQESIFFLMLQNATETLTGLSLCAIVGFDIAENDPYGVSFNIEEPGGVRNCSARACEHKLLSAYQTCRAWTIEIGLRWHRMSSTLKICTRMRRKQSWTISPQSRIQCQRLQFARTKKSTGQMTAVLFIQLALKYSEQTSLVFCL